MSEAIHVLRTNIGAREIWILRIAAGALAIFVGWVHVLHPDYGYTQLLLYVEFGTVYDPRPPLFVLSGLAIFVGVVLLIYDRSKRHLYLLGILLMVTYIVGYVSWHTVLDHGAFWPYIEAHHHHEVGVIESMVDHLRADTIAMVSKLAELLLLVLLGLLYRFDTD